MERLTMLFVAVLAATTFAQGRDLGGTWLLDAEKSSTKQGPATMTIVLGANEFKVTMGDGTRAATLAFKLDGTETELEHGNKGKAEWKGDKLEATIAIRTAGERLAIEVRDAGPGLDPSHATPPAGVGLRNTSERLKYLYGADHSFQLKTLDGGGLEVAIDLPFRRS